MFNQFLGNYLINERIITNEQLLIALAKKKNKKIKLGTLAINKGYMTYEQVEKIHELQKIMDKKIGDIAVQEGYLTSNQVIKLLSYQVPEYLLLGQALIDEEFISEKQFSEIIDKYKEEFSVLKNAKSEQNIKIAELLETFYDFYDIMAEENIFKYFLLLMNNFIRFIGDDFYIKDISKKTLSMEKYNFSQSIDGKLKLKSIISIEENELLKFSSRFASDEFEKVDEYVEAGAADFLNVHNGIFIVNQSNNMGLELTLTPLEEILEPVEATCITIQYPFGKFEYFIVIE